MNREIKFRAWEEGCNFMNDQVKIIVNPFGCGETYYQVTDATNWIDVPRHHVMQWTGLKDKNDVEIYEGDLVNIVWCGHDGEVNKEIIVVKNIFDYTIEEATLINYAEEIEVIGNIYENPELL